MSWFKELTSKAEAVLVKLDRDAAQALQNPTSILSDLTFAEQETTVTIESTSRESLNNRTLDHSDLLSDTVVHPPVPQDTFREEVQHVEPDSTSNVSTGTTADSTDPVTKQQSPTKPLTKIIPGDIRVENQQAKSKKPAIKLVQDDVASIESVEDTNVGNIVHSKKFTIQTSRNKSNLFSEIDNRSRNGLTSSDKRGANRNSAREEIPNLGADDIRASINQTLREYSRTYLSTTNNQSNHNHSSHFDDSPYIVQDHDELDSSSRRRSSALSCSIDFPPGDGDLGQKTDITARLLEKNILKRKSAFNLHRVINKLANTNASDYIVFNDQKRVKFRRFKLRMATSLRRLNYYFQTYPNMKYYAIGYVVLMQLLAVYVLFFYQSTPTPSDLSIQINRQLERAEETNAR